MQEMRTDIGRIDSNQETQKKYFHQQLLRVEGLAQTAVDRTTGIQEQLDSVRQQTRDLHESLMSMNKHSQVLTKGLTEMIHGFKDLRFHMPTMFDDWLAVKLGGNASTINSRDANHAWNTPCLPLVLPTRPTSEPASDERGNLSSSLPPFHWRAVQAARQVVSR